MILSRIEHIILDDFPLTLVPVIRFLISQHQHLCSKVAGNYYHTGLNVHYQIIEQINLDLTHYWQSHSKIFSLFVVLEGEEIIDINDKSDLTPASPYNSQRDLFLYTGHAQTRIRLKKNNVLILSPEDAYRFHYIPNIKIKKVSFQIPLFL